MKCASVGANIKGILSSLPGVDSVSVEYDEEKIMVTYTESKVTPETMIHKVGDETGIGLHIVE